MENDPKKTQTKNFNIAAIAFAVGILALAAAIISGFGNLNYRLLACEGAALLSLVVLLIVTVRNRKIAESDAVQKSNNPYASADKNEIHKILDMISEEEKKRKKLDAFAAGTAAEAEEDEAEDTSSDDDELRFLVIDDEVSEDSSNPEPVKKSDNGHENEKSSDESSKKDNDEKSNQKKDNLEEDAELASYDDYDDRPARRRPAENADRRERDPYYDDYYDDRRRNPRDSRERDARDSRDREPYASRGYYNEYGEPVRRRRPAPYDPYYDDYYDDRQRRTSRDMGERDSRDRDPYASRGYYNEYGEPVRRRPAQPQYDDRRPAQQPRRRRPPDGYPENGRPRPRYEDDERARRPEIASAEAHEEKTDNVNHVSEPAPEPVSVPEKKEAEYDENYVPVVIPDDDYDYDEERYSHSGRAGIGSLDRAEGSHDLEDSHDDRYDDRRSDNRFDDRRDERANGSARAAEDDNYRSAARSQKAEDSYVPDYEDEIVVSLPRDDEYESYIEQKREEERKAELEREKEKRKAERRASGKIALTIVKLRRRKIRRKSRKYKNFRASVNHLGNYLNSFSAKTGRK